MDHLWQRVEEYIEKNLEITMDEPDPDVDAYISGVLDLLDWDDLLMDDADLQRRSQHRHRVQDAKAEFQVMFRGSCPITNKIRHYCPLGCCPRGRSQSVERAFNSMAGLLLTTLPPIPACNRQTPL